MKCIEAHWTWYSHVVIQGLDIILSLYFRFTFIVFLHHHLFHRYHQCDGLDFAVFILTSYFILSAYITLSRSCALLC